MKSYIDKNWKNNKGKKIWIITMPLRHMQLNKSQTANRRSILNVKIQSFRIAPSNANRKRETSPENTAVHLVPFIKERQLQITARMRNNSTIDNHAGEVAKERDNRIETKNLHYALLETAEKVISPILNNRPLSHQLPLPNLKLEARPLPGHLFLLEQTSNMTHHMLLPSLKRISLNA